MLVLWVIVTGIRYSDRLTNPATHGCRRHGGIRMWLRGHSGVDLCEFSRAYFPGVTLLRVQVNKRLRSRIPPPHRRAPRGPSRSPAGRQEGYEPLELPCFPPTP